MKTYMLILEQDEISFNNQGICTKAFVVQMLRNHLLSVQDLSMMIIPIPQDYFL
jgi:hypothetical protein